MPQLCARSGLVLAALACLTTFPVMANAQVLVQPGTTVKLPSLDLPDTVALRAPRPYGDPPLEAGGQRDVYASITKTYTFGIGVQLRYYPGLTGPASVVIPAGALHVNFKVTATPGALPKFTELVVRGWTMDSVHHSTRVVVYVVRN